MGNPARSVGILVAGLGLVGYPLLAPAIGRGWRQSEVFGWMPDPTALVTLLGSVSWFLEVTLASMLILVIGK